MILNLVVLIIACYLVGSIPVAWLITKLVTGGDIRHMGSGNVGVMNVALSVARWAGFLVFVTEAVKGIIAVLLAQYMGGDVAFLGAAVIAAVVGTRWSIWLRGAGGRGNTTGVGAMLLIGWYLIPIGIATWTVARLVTRSSFWATRVSFVLMPVLLGLATQSWWFVFFGIILSVIYLSTQAPETDDHLLIKERWPNLWAFLSSPPRE
jgi:glycerol-3-phosphate acyltransferase PlsY